MLDVYLHDAFTGRIRQGAHGLLTFEYGERALDDPGTSQLSIRLPVRAEPYDHDGTTAFFENLLPEGEGRDLLAQARHFSASDVPGLLGMVGGGLSRTRAQRARLDQARRPGRAPRLISFRGPSPSAPPFVRMTSA